MSTIWNDVNALRNRSNDDGGRFNIPPEIPSTIEEYMPIALRRARICEERQLVLEKQINKMDNLGIKNQPKKKKIKDKGWGSKKRINQPQMRQRQKK